MQLASLSLVRLAVQGESLFSARGVLVARVATGRFQVLMPETTESGAERLGERLAGRCRTFIERTGAPIAVRVSVAGTGLQDSLQDSLQDALAHALRAIEAA